MITLDSHMTYHLPFPFQGYLAGREQRSEDTEEGAESRPGGREGTSEVGISSIET